MTTIARGIHDPAPRAPARAPGSLRRSSHVDMTTTKGVLQLDAAARDVLTRPDSTTDVVATATVAATVGPDSVLRQIEVGGGDPRVQQLVGRVVGRGFREAIDEALPEHRRDQTLLYLMLEELPVARLISGYAALYRRPEHVSANAPALPADICAGWRHDGTMMVAIDQTGEIPVPLGPMVPPADPADADAWHPMEPLAPGAMRRKRLVDVMDGEPLGVRAMFRDTHVEAGGTETILHEYEVTGTVDGDTLEVLSATARPRVLPWPECPNAAASAGRLVGHPVGEIRSFVRQDLRGVTTCTHLNDLLRSMGDIGALATTLRSRLIP